MAQFNSFTINDTLHCVHFDNVLAVFDNDKNDYSNFRSDIRCMTLAIMKASRSPDPSTQVGACLVAPRSSGYLYDYSDYRTKNEMNVGFICLGCNEPTRNLTLSDQEMANKDIKYALVEHAERNAIFEASRNNIPTFGARLYCTWYACCDCARAIAQSGIKTVYGLDFFMNAKYPDRWQESIAHGNRILQAAGVERKLITEKSRKQIKSYLIDLNDSQCLVNDEFIVELRSNTHHSSKVIDVLRSEMDRVGLYRPKLRFLGETLEIV